MKVRSQPTRQSSLPAAAQGTPETGALRTLSSGKQMRVMLSRPEQGPPISLTFEYATDIPLSERERLANEVEKVWSDLVKKEAGVAAEAAPMLAQYIGDADREVFVIAMLTIRHRVLGLHTVSVGCLTSSLVNITPFMPIGADSEGHH